MLEKKGSAALLLSRSFCKVKVWEKLNRSAGGKKVQRNPKLPVEYKKKEIKKEPRDEKDESLIAFLEKAYLESKAAKNLNGGVGSRKKLEDPLLEDKNYANSINKPLQMKPKTTVLSTEIISGRSYDYVEKSLEKVRSGFQKKFVNSVLSCKSCVDDSENLLNTPKPLPAPPKPVPIPSRSKQTPNGKGVKKESVLNKSCSQSVPAKRYFP